MLKTTDKADRTRAEAEFVIHLMDGAQSHLHAIMHDWALIGYRKPITIKVMVNTELIEDSLGRVFFHLETEEDCRAMVPGDLISFEGNTYRCESFGWHQVYDVPALRR